MAGIYLHIPFCKQACYYCDFHFSTNLSQKSRMINCIANETDIMHDYINEPVQTIYFGGGTPSLLTEAELGILLEHVFQQYAVVEYPEITLEANPDDIDATKLAIWKKAGINRLSVGVQTFNPELLNYLNRAHNAEQAKQAIHLAKAFGFDNLNLDLIFALPHQTQDILKNDLNTLLYFEPAHIATYNLTIESNTVFGNWYRKGKLQQVNDDTAAKHYQLIIDELTRGGYEHYEISNFALPGKYSTHNTNYWQHINYLGLGPGAHSYNGKQRHFNISNNALYMKGVETGNLNQSFEELTRLDLINEFILTGLRSQRGCNLKLLSEKLDFDLAYIEKKTLLKYIENGYLELNNKILRLTPKGKFIADEITGELFQV